MHESLVNQCSEICQSVVWDGCRAHLSGFISHAGYTWGVGGITGPVAWQIGDSEGIQGGSPADTGTAATAAHWTSQWNSAPLCDSQRWQKIQEEKWSQFGEVYNKGKKSGGGKKEQMESGRETKRKTSIRGLTCKTSKVH